MERLPRAARLIYASGSIGGNAISRTVDLWLLYFYAPPADADIPRRASTLLVGVVLTAIRLVEALDDPIIGYWSDRTRSRWGRRIPFVLLATPFLSLFFVLLWLPPVGHSSGGNAGFLVVVLWCFYLFSTLSGGPFESLLPEIAPRNEDRLSIVSWQVGFGVLGALLALVVSGLIIDRWGFVAMALVMAAVALVSRFLALAGAWRRATSIARERPEPPAMMSVREAVTACLRNDQFAAFLPTFIFYNMGVQMMTGVMPFLVTEVLQKEEEGRMVAIMNGVAIGVVVAALAPMVFLARRAGKRLVYSAGMLFASCYFPLLFFVGFLPVVPKDAQAIAFAALMGLPLAPLQTFPNALIADITDYDALQTGMRREATYYATQATFEKLASAMAPGLLAALLVIGSTRDDPWGIRLVGPIAGLATFVGYLAFRRYWLPDTVTAETIAAARAHKTHGPKPASTLPRP